MREYKTASTEETEALARELAKELRPGDVLAFTGGMGAGKTAFVRGLAQGLNVSGEVSSPTFALVHEYPGEIPLYHFDMYRIDSLDDLYSTGYFDYLEQGGILAVEWSENIAAALEEGTIRVNIAVTGENTRTITLEGGGRF